MQSELIEKVISALSCPVCKDNLARPVILPCGLTVCQAHTDTSTTASSCFTCVGCDKLHTRPDEGFIPNKCLEALVNVQKGKEHKKGLLLCQELKADIDKLGQTLKDPHNFLHNQVFEYHNMVDLKRERLKLAIDEQADSLHKSLDEFEKDRRNFVDSGKLMVKFQDELEKFKKEHDSYVDGLQRLNVRNTRAYAKCLQLQCRDQLNSISKIIYKSQRLLKLPKDSKLNQHLKAFLELGTLIANEDDDSVILILYFSC